MTGQFLQTFWMVKKYISFAKVKTYEEHNLLIWKCSKISLKRCKSLYGEIFRITKTTQVWRTGDNAIIEKKRKTAKKWRIQYRTSWRFLQISEEKAEKLTKQVYEEQWYWKSTHWAKNCQKITMLALCSEEKYFANLKNTNISWIYKRWKWNF